MSAAGAVKRREFSNYLRQNRQFHLHVCRFADDKCVSLQELCSGEEEAKDSAGK